MPQEAAKNAKKRFLLFNVTLFSVGGVLLAYVLFSKFSGLHFPCMFSLVMHLYCPGCGCTRAAEALLRFDLLASLAANPTVLLGGCLLLYYEIRLFLFMKRGKDRAPSLLPAVIFFGCFTVYAVLRNVLLVYFQIDPLGDHLMYWS